MTHCKYYSPVADVTFRKVFGENIDLAASLLNAFLPLEEGRTITDLQYVPYKLMPKAPTSNYNYVNLSCQDSARETFLVEIQLNWDTDFLSQLYINTPNVYVREFDKGKRFQLTKPVYSLNFVQGDLHKGLSEWYHPYKFVHIYHTERVFEGPQIVFAEMEKYGKLPVKGNAKKDLWMRYFTEMTERTRRPAPELLADPDIAKAIGLLEVINYSEAEEYLYDKYWDAVRIEATWKGIGRREGEKAGIEKGLKQGIEQGSKQGREKGLAEGREAEKRLLILNMLAKGLDPALVAEIAGLTVEEVQATVRG